MNMNQKKKTTNDHTTSPKDQLIPFPLLRHRRPVLGPYFSQRERLRSSCGSGENCLAQQERDQQEPPDGEVRDEQHEHEDARPAEHECVAIATYPGRGGHAFASAERLALGLDVPEPRFLVGTRAGSPASSGVSDGVSAMGSPRP
jgi:hypothetical protein